MDSLRPYQIDGIERGKTSLDNNGFYLGDEMGIGKSAQALELVKSYSVLVVCPKNAVGVWEAEFRKWKGATHVHKFLGSPGVRYQGWVAYRDCPEVFKALITTYSLLGKLLDEARSPIFGTVIFDEIHHIRNRKTRSYDSAKHLRAGRKIGLSGSPIVNRPDDVWAPLSVLFPNEYRSYWNWVGEHLVNLQGDFGVEVGGMKAPEAFRESISAHFLRRTKTQVEIDLPPKQRVEIPLELEGAQLKLYRDMANRMVAELPSGELLTTPSHLGKITRLRQILVSPALVGSDAPSALLEALGE